MSELQRTNPPFWYWIIAGMALIWNALGVMAYLMQVMMSKEAMNNLPLAHQDLYAATPMWVTGAFAIAVFAATLGSLALLFRKSCAFPLFGISFLGILLQQAYLFFLSNTFEVMGNSAKVMPVMILITGLFLVWFSRSSKTRNWIS